MTMYACTYFEKIAEADHFKRGVTPDTYTVVASEGCNIAANTLPKLIAAIEQCYGLEIADVWLPEENGVVSRIGFNQLECADGTIPSEHELSQWKQGKLVLYLCDYDFSIEKRGEGAVPVEKFEQAGVKHHT